jgi:putative tryptophan/tyrosine transport system substrate-binding protein
MRRSNSGHKQFGYGAATSLSPLGATCRSTPAGPRAIRTTHAGSRLSWWHRGLMSFFTVGSAAMAPLRQATRTIPIVFAIVPDPVGAGFVDSLARPGSNSTGFTSFEYSIGAKWLELLKQIAPEVTRAAIVRDPAITAGIGQWGAIQSVAPLLGVELSPVNVEDAGEIERAVAAFARSANAGMILTGSALAIVHRNLIIALAARHKLPTVYYDRYFVAAGGLISYGPDIIDQFRRTAGYVDRILKGEKPADLPIQAPTKYETVLNLKTARTLGLEVPTTVLARADEVIECGAASSSLCSAALRPRGRLRRGHNSDRRCRLLGIQPAGRQLDRY